MESGRLGAAAAFSGRNICETLGGSSSGGGAGTGSKGSQGCAHRDNCPAGRLPRLLQRHFPPPAGMRQRPSCATRNLSVSVASCFSILLLVVISDGRAAQNENSSSSLIKYTVLFLCRDFHMASTSDLMQKLNRRQQIPLSMCCRLINKCFSIGGHYNLRMGRHRGAELTTDWLKVYTLAWYRLKAPALLGHKLSRCSLRDAEISRDLCSLNSA